MFFIAGEPAVRRGVQLPERTDFEALPAADRGGWAQREYGMRQLVGNGPAAHGGGINLETETAVFILANVLDIFLTYLLLVGGGHDEGNPVARYFLDRWGLKGMFLYKLSAVAVVCVIAQVVARASVSTARKLLVGLTIVVGAVVAYSAVLLLQAG